MSKLQTGLEPTAAPGADQPIGTLSAAVESATTRSNSTAAAIANSWLAKWPALIVVAMATVWAGEFAWLALQRHFAGGSHAEDLGFTEQVLANFLRGQWFRMSIYQGATWNTEIDLGHIARPDSLLAFHFEPMLLLLVPLYAVGGISWLLVIQAGLLAAGALPAYRLGKHCSESASAGMAVAAAYLLSPLGQWAVLADFHTLTLAAPLLVLALERLVVHKSTTQALLVAGLAATAREDVGLAIATLGLAVLLHHAAKLPRGAFPLPRWAPQVGAIPISGPTRVAVSTAPRLAGKGLLAGLGFLALGVGASVFGLVVIRSYSGGGLPFDARYAETIGLGLGAALAALERPAVLGYAQTLLLSGGWLGLFAPLALVPALPSLALNALSTSPWMAAGKAHYSVLVLPFIVLGAAAGLRQVRARPRLVQVLSACLVLSGAAAYARDGSGPLGGNFAPATVTQHALRAESLAESLPPDAAVSASSALVPRLTHRAHVYVFPAVLDAEYVFVDLHASASPTSAGDVFLRTRDLVASGGWQVQAADDGLLLLQRDAGASSPGLPPMLRYPILTNTAATISTEPSHSYDNGRVSLLSADLMPSPDGAVDVDGPRWILRTIWRAEQPLARGSHLDFWLTLRDGQQVHVWDVAPLWWNPPEQWPPDLPVTIDVADVPVREFVSWQAVVSEP